MRASCSKGNAARPHRAPPPPPQSQARLAGLEATAARFDQLTAVAEQTARGIHGAADAALHGMSRELVALQVATPLIVRKYNLVKAELAAARTAARTAEVRPLRGRVLASLAALVCPASFQANAVATETELRSRILYLELWKVGTRSCARISMLRPYPSSSPPLRPRPVARRD